MYKNSAIQAVRLLEPRKKVHTGWKIPYVHLLGPVRLFGSPEYSVYPMVDLYCV